MTKHHLKINFQVKKNSSALKPYSKRCKNMNGRKAYLTLKALKIARYAIPIAVIAAAAVILPQSGDPQEVDDLAI